MTRTISEHGENPVRRHHLVHCGSNSKMAFCWLDRFHAILKSAKFMLRHRKNMQVICIDLNQLLPCKETIITNVLQKQGFWRCGVKCRDLGSPCNYCGFALCFTRVSPSPCYSTAKLLSQWKESVPLPPLNMTSQDKWPSIALSLPTKSRLFKKPLREHIGLTQNRKTSS